MNEQLPVAVDEQPNVEAPPTVTRALPVTTFDKLAAALAACTKEIGEHPVIKRGKNAFHGYKYPRIEDVMDVVSDALSKTGLVLQQSEVAQGFLDKGGVVYVTYEFYFMHESGQCSPLPVKHTGQSRTRDSKGGYDDKSILKCHTQARKAFLMSTFQIKTLDEGDTRSRRSQAQPQPEIQQPPDVPETIFKPDQPVAIPRGDGQWQGWTRVWLTMVNAAPTIEIVEQWLELNRDTLNLLRDELEAHHQYIVREYNKRLRKLSPSEAS